MTPEQFCYWLQGRVELQPGNLPSADEWKMIGEHLSTVFKKVTPQIGQLPHYGQWAQSNPPVPSLMQSIC